MVANVKDMFKILGVTRKAAVELLEQHQTKAPEVITAPTATQANTKGPVAAQDEKDMAKMMRDVLLRF